jgi:hypothetical protein
LSVQPEDVTRAVETAFLDHEEEYHRPQPQPIVAIQPFAATVFQHAGSDTGGPVRVIGIRQKDDGLIEMIALVAGDDGTLWPEAFESVQADLPY